ncbi:MULTISPECIES: hypothetical protein [unclassified Streptomyces]|uniref:hypothetical protein n=1 Tax=unclassified Streptomyces TaxID=2593676 RepID=UPI00081DE0A6|nr:MULTISPECIES: hypothetical protein [unclassified Streptomyces]MYR92362.1 hypothetical protein [Streptomyces sp. SID4937]SCD32428.1 hypothetical protein GA0115243_10106 [Streptomyces sp. ScaeMP-e83]
MTLLHPSGAFTAVKRHFAEPWTAEELRLEVFAERGTIPLTPTQAFEGLYGPVDNPALESEIWRVCIRRAKDECEAGAGGRWQLLLIWLLLPRLSGTVYRVCTRLRASRPDVETEAVLGLLESLTTLDPDFPDAAAVLAGAAKSHAWRSARSARPMISVGHIEALVTEDDHPGAEGSSAVEGRPSSWEVEITPPNDPDGLRAPLRFPVSAAQLEGERLGALAHQLGIHDVVRRARRPQRGRRIGSISVRPGRRHQR